MTTTTVIEHLGFYRKILFLSHAGRSREVQFFQFGNCVLDVAQQHVCHVAAESLTHNHTHHYIIFQFRRQCISRNHPAVLRQLILQIVQCPFGCFCIFRFQIPDEQWVHYIFGVVNERSHLGDFIQDDNVPVPADAAAFTLLKEQLVEVLSTLTDREQKVLRLRFGLDDGRARTLEEVGKEFNVTRERIRQIEAKALRKLRHPSRSRKLKDYLD